MGSRSRWRSQSETVTCEGEIRSAQERYANETSFARVAERYAEVLAL